MRRGSLLWLWLVGCATAPVVASSSTVEETRVEDTRAESSAPQLVAPGEVVLQTPYDSPIRTLIAEPGWGHFITSAGGEVAVHDRATGAVRAWRRPWARADVAIDHDASGTVLLLTPTSSYEHIAFLWSLQDDRLTVLPRSVIGIHPGGQRLLVAGGREGAVTLSIEEVGSRRVLATRTDPEARYARFTPDGETLVLTQPLPDGRGYDVSLADAQTLSTRTQLGTSSFPSVLKRMNGVLMSTADGIELRATRDGHPMGRILPEESHGVSISGPDEAYDGSCLALAIPETHRVRLYRTTDLTFVHEADMQGFGSYAVLPACAGLVGQAPTGELRSFGPGLPSEGAPFGSPGTEPNLFTGEMMRPVALVAPDTAIATNGIALAAITRGVPAPRFVVTPAAVTRTRSPWAYGFLSSGAVFVMGRGFVHTIGPNGLTPAVCMGPADVMVSPAGITSLGDVAQFCDLERQRSELWDVRSPTQAGRFVLVQDQTPTMRVLDLEQGTSTPVPAGVAPYRTPVAVSESGRVVAFAHSNGTDLRLVDVTRRTRPPTSLALRHRATRHMLYDTMLVVESEGRVTLYGLDGSVPVDREVVATGYVPPTPVRSVFLVSDRARTDVIEARSGVTLATLDGAPVPEMYAGSFFDPDPRLPLPVIRHGDTTAFVRVTDGHANLLPLGDARVLGSDPLERFLAVCRAGALTVVEVATENSRAFGACLDSDRVRLRGDGGALLMVRGVRIALRTPDGETVLSLLDRSGAPLLLLSNEAGAYAGSADLVPSMRFRHAGPLLTAPLDALTAGSESRALFRAFGAAP